MTAISEMVTDGKTVWLETQRFYYFSRRQAMKTFEAYVEQQGWWFV